MQRTRPGRRSPRRKTWAIAATAAAALIGLTAQTQSAYAGSAISDNAHQTSATTTAKTGTTTPAKADKADKADTKGAVSALCATPKSKDMARCFALQLNSVKGGKGVQPHADAPTGFGAADLQDAYNLPADGGAGETIAIVDAYDNPNAEADLQVYRAQYGLPECSTANGCFKKVNQEGVEGSYPSPDAGWAGEIALDIDMVSAAAPNAHILLVEADSAYNDDLGAAVNTAVALGAKYVSNSYGSGYSSTPGSGEDPIELQYDDQYYKHPGVVVTASSGDGDFGVSYPAASQYVTSVGGTALVKDSSSRGWSESVWHNSYGGPGSGCSMYEPKPAFQGADTDCDMRSVADVSAVADPVTGVSVYNTYQDDGWLQYGGTSASSPLIAGVYAAAGTPATDTFPNSYPYENASSLNDVTVGNNGTCDPAKQCTAGPGYDGPTGLGTPNGLAAFTTGPHGKVAGTITDKSSGDPLSGATVTVGDASATTGADGKYTLTVPVGTYDVTASAYGYKSVTRAGVAIAENETVTEAFALAPVPKVTVSGTVTDGSGHGWPLYARISIDGVPGGPVFTDPYTGHYSIEVPKGTYSLNTTANYPGYQAPVTTVKAGSADVVKDIKVKIDTEACTAPGYAPKSTGTTQPFDGTTAPAGWSVTNGTDDGGWQFTDDGNRGNHTGGEGNFAIVDSDHIGTGKTEDTVLTAPAQDFTSATNPRVTFDTDYKAYSSSTADVELSTDGGTTWSSVWNESTTSLVGPAHVEVPLTAAAGKSGALVRFHYKGAYAYWWQVDDVFLGNRTCDKVAGGLVAGQVLDTNTNDGVNGATVSSDDAPDTSATTAATPDDPNLGDGFYWAYSSKTGSRSFTAAKAKYVSATKDVDVAANYTTKSDFSLDAGQLSVTPGSIDKTLPWGGSVTSTLLTLKNTGTAPVNVKVGEQSGDFVLQAKGAAKRNVKTKTNMGWLASKSANAKAKKQAAPAAQPADAPWTPIADLPGLIQDNVAGVDNGTVYSAFGYDGSADTSDLYAFDTAAGSWTKKASAADTRESPAHGFINGKWYISGGWGSTGDPDSKTEVYDPSSDAWSTAAENPKPYAGSGSAVLDGKLYVVGGCTGTACGSTDVSVYDAAADSWSSVADYPEDVAWESCGGIDGKLYCAGGTTDAGSISHGYVYDPGADSWSPIADLPADLWGSAMTAANGLLVVSGGVIDNGATITNTGFAYDPSNDSWTGIPNSNTATYRGGSACGMYKLGGSPGGLGTPPVKTGEYLPGFDQCGGAADVTWLSEGTNELTLQPGKAAKVPVTFDASVPEITQPGKYNAALTFTADTPYKVDSLPVSMTVKPPTSWGKILGTVTGLDASGNASPLAGATVQIDSWATGYTLTTAKDGGYALWLDSRNNPLTLIVAKDGYQPQTKTVKIVKGKPVVTNFALKKR